MPRNSAGTYTLPVGNPVTSGTTISSSWANTTLSDLATAMTGSLARNGDGGMTGQFKADSGSGAAPGISWASETTSGWYRAGTGDFRFSIAGTDVVTITATALAATGNATIGGTLGVTGATTLGALTVGTSITLPAASVADAALSSNVPLKNAANTFTASQTIAATDATLSLGDGTRSLVLGVDQTSNASFLSGTGPFDIYVASAKRGSISATGNWTINAPSSGTALTATANSAAAGYFSSTGSVSLQITGGNSGTGAAAQFTDGQSGTRSYQVGVGILGAGGSFSIYDTTAAATRLNISAAGNVTINAPGSGVALATFGVAGSQNARFAGGGTAYGNIESSDTGGTNAWTFGRDNVTTGDFVLAFNGSLFTKVFAGTGGVNIGSPTGGDKGAGTLNTAGQIYINNLEVGFKIVPRRTSSFADGECSALSSGITLDAGYAAGSCFSFYNDSGSAITITQGGGLTLRLAGTATTGSRTLAARGICTVWCNSTTEYIISGGGVS